MIRRFIYMSNVLSRGVSINLFALLAATPERRGTLAGCPVSTWRTKRGGRRSALELPVTSRGLSRCNVVTPVTSRAVGITELDNLGSAESFRLTATRLPGGSFSFRSGTSQIETVTLANRVLAAAFRLEAGRPPA